MTTADFAAFPAQASLRGAAVPAAQAVEIAPAAVGPDAAGGEGGRRRRGRTGHWRGRGVA